MSKKFFVVVNLFGEVWGFTHDEPERRTVQGLNRDVDFQTGIEFDELPAQLVSILGAGSSPEPSGTITGEFVRDWWIDAEHRPIELADVAWYWADDDEDLDRSTELYRGSPRSVNWDIGTAYASVSFGTSPNERLLNVAFPPAVIGDARRFPDAPESSKGHAVPVIYGTAYGVPLSPIGNDRYVVAGHRISSASIQVMSEGTLVGSESVSEGRDGRGGVYTYVTVSSGDVTENSALYAESVIGKVGPGGDAIDRLGDVLEDLVRTYNPEAWGSLDHARISAAKPSLNKCRIGFFVNQPERDGNIIQFIESRLADQFPMNFDTSGGRIGWDSTLLPPDDADVLFDLTMGINAHDRTSGPSAVGVGEVVTNLEFAYRTNGVEGGTIESIFLDSETSGRMRRAVSKWGARPRERIEAGDVVDAATAYVVATNIARMRGGARFVVEYGDAPVELQRVPLMSIGVITDDELGWSRKRVILVGRRPNMHGRIDAVFVTLEEF